MNKIKLTISVISGLLLGQLAALADNVTVNFGDLVLGFRNTGGQGTGQSLNLEVNLGNFSQFLTATSPIVLSGPNGLAVQDLVNTYGANWNSNSGLLWSVASTSDGSGVGGLADNTLFVTSTGTVFKRQTGAVQQTVNDNITNFTNSLNDVAPTANSTQSSVIDTTNTGTANYNGGISNGGSFGRPYNATSASLMSFPVVENTTSISGPFNSLKLEELTPTTSGTANAAILGAFELFSDGTFEFVPQAVPEPSTWLAGALTGGGIVGLWVRRRMAKRGT